MEGPWGIKRHIDAAAVVARELWSMGFAVICPHMNTAMMDGVSIPDRTFLDGDLEMLRRCDVIVMLPTWVNSHGARNEKEFAESEGIPVLYWPERRNKRAMALLSRAAVKAKVRWSHPTSQHVAPEVAASVLGRHAADVRRGRDATVAGPSLFDSTKEAA